MIVGVVADEAVAAALGNRVVVDLAQAGDVIRATEAEDERADTHVGREAHGVLLGAGHEHRRVRCLHRAGSDRA